MANQTVTVNKTLTQVISDGLGNGQNLTINAGATVTVTESPTVLVGQISINDGELLLDGANATNPIVFVGELNEEVNVNGAGVLRSSLGWWEFPTTSNGNANQTFNVSTYFDSAGIDADVFSGVWVETGRRINYDGGSGVAPVVGDWVFAVNDQSIHGRITEVSGTASSGYFVVRFLTGSLSNNDQIELHTIQDHFGPDYQISWTGNCNGADVLESGVYQEFGNAHQNNINGMSLCGAGMGGFVFAQAYQSNTLTFGDGTNGFIPPNGAKIRVPMVHFATGTTTTFAADASIWGTGTSRYELETVNGGDCYLDGASFGSAYFEDSLGGQFQASYCAANTGFGVYAAIGRTSYDHCIFVGDIDGDTLSAGRSVPPIVDLVSGADIRDCLGVATNDSAETSQFGGQTSIGVNIERCIQLGVSVATEAEFVRVNDFTVYDFVMIGAPFVFTTSNNATIKLLKTQRNMDGSVAGSDQIYMSASCSNIKFTGWEILNNSCPDDSKIAIVDSNNIAVRGFHFIDRKFDNEALGGTQGEEFVSIGGLCSDITLSRCWTDRGTPNEFALIASGTSKNVLIQNCSGEYNGEIDPDGINTLFRGFHGGSGKLGSGSGLETDYPGTAGAMMGDAFESNTKGYIYYRAAPGTDEYPLTILSGNPKFTKDGDVDSVSGDQWEVDMGYVALGHIAFSGNVTTTRNAIQTAEGVNNWSQVDIDFQYDTGTGYNGTWLDLRTPSNLTSISGMVDGIRLKLRFTGNATTVNGQAITIHTTTTIADQYANLYPLDQAEVDLAVTVLDAATLAPIQNARVYVLAGPGGPLTEGSVIINGLTNSSGQILVNSYAYAGDQPVIGKARRGTNPTFYKSAIISGAITTSGLDVSAFMVKDQ